MSIAIASEVEKRGHTAEKLLELVDRRYGVVAVRMGTLRELGEGAMAWPTEAEPWHGIVFVADGSKRKRAVRSAIADSARWVVAPRKSV
jgi:hypothetical protein